MKRCDVVFSLGIVPAIITLGNDFYGRPENAGAVLVANLCVLTLQLIVGWPLIKNLWRSK